VNLDTPTLKPARDASSQGNREFSYLGRIDHAIGQRTAGAIVFLPSIHKVPHPAVLLREFFVIHM
jgi:hypothetical protein